MRGVSSGLVTEPSRCVVPLKWTAPMKCFFYALAVEFTGYHEEENDKRDTKNDKRRFPKRMHLSQLYC